MIEAAVIVELLAVVGDEDEQRVALDSECLELRAERTEARVEERDLAVVERVEEGEVVGREPFGALDQPADRSVACDGRADFRPGEARRVVGRRAVGSVRVGRMEIEEERAGVMRFEPGGTPPGSARRRTRTASRGPRAPRDSGSRRSRARSRSGRRRSNW
jgi:hypothetical protein